MKKLFLLVAILLILPTCGTNVQEGIYDEPTLIAVDSDNNRLFVLEKNGKLFILDAATRNGIGSQPAVDEDHETAIHDLLPYSPTDMAVLDIGGTSRLFISGTQEDDNGNSVFNRLLVLDFDGTTLSAASFSPVIISDGDDETTDTDNLIGGLQVDRNNAQLYVTDSSLGALYILNGNDGSEASASIAVTGTPNKMSLDGGRLYVANSTDTEDDEVITVVNTDDWTATEIDLDVATDDIAVLSNDNGTAILAKQQGQQRVFVRTVDTATYAASTAISVGDSSAEDGQMTSGNGISGAVGRILLTKNSSGTIYGYVPQADGNIALVTISPDLSSFTVTSLSTATDVLNGIDVLLDSNNNGQTVYIAASGSGDLVYTEVGSSSVSARF